MHCGADKVYHIEAVKAAALIEQFPIRSIPDAIAAVLEAVILTVKDVLHEAARENAEAGVLSPNVIFNPLAKFRRALNGRIMGINRPEIMGDIFKRNNDLRAYVFRGTEHRPL